MTHVIDIRAFQDNRPTGVHIYGEDYIREVVSCDEEVVFWSSGMRKAILTPYLKQLCDSGKVKYIHSFLPNKVLNLLWYFFRFPKVDWLVWAGGARPHSIQFSVLDPRPLPLSKNIKKNLVIHDLVQFRLPSAYSFKSKIRFFMMRLSKEILESSKIICVSNFTKSELFHFFPNAKNVFVRRYSTKIIRKNLQDSKFDKHKPFLLSVSTLEPRKNFAELQKLFLSGFFAEKFKYLVCVGKFDNAIFSKAKLLQDPNIIYTGYLNESDRNALYSKAAGFASFSVYEGFGLSLYEAMQFDLDLFISDIPSHREVVGNYKKVQWFKV